MPQTRSMVLAVVAGAVFSWAACVSPDSPNDPQPSIRDIADQRTRSSNRTALDDTDLTETRGNTSTIIAIVNGIPITRARVVELLLRAHGAGLLEQIVGLELAGQLAAERGLSINESDVESEYNLALRRLSDPLATIVPEDFDRDSAERVLDSVLEERNISREEFFITIRRNAYLRKVVSCDLTISPDELRAEYDRVYGERAEVRHIQLGSDGDVRRVLERLKAGDDFAALANRYSANTSSARNGGRLTPFSRTDQAVPKEFRDAAFALSPGEVSPVVRIGEWQHLIRLERIIPADDRPLEVVRGELETQLRARLAEVKMHELFLRLMREATIEIRNPNVRDAYQKRQQGSP